MYCMASLYVYICTSTGETCSDENCENGCCDQDTGTCVCHPFYTGENCSEALC